MLIAYLVNDTQKLEKVTLDKTTRNLCPTWSFPPHSPPGRLATHYCSSRKSLRTDLRLAALCSQNWISLTWTALPATGIGFQSRTQSYGSILLY